MTVWNKIVEFFFPKEPEPTLIETVQEIVKEEKKEEEVKKNPPKPRKPRAKKVKNENT